MALMKRLTVGLLFLAACGGEPGEGDVAFAQMESNAGDACPDFAQCLGSELQTCSDGVWETVQTCASPAHCQPGEPAHCTPPE